MAFVSNSLNFPNLTSKGSPTTSDIIMLSDAAASSALKQATIGNLPFLSSASTVTVPQGGTGVSSATAYAVQCGGTTSTGAFQSVASVGTSGQLLTSNGASALPTFQTASAVGGSLTFLASATASTSATIDFSNNLSATYDNYLILIEDLIAATASVNFQLRVGTGAGPTYQTTSYNGCYVTRGTAGSSGSSNQTNSGTGAIDLGTSGAIASTANRSGSFRINVNNANNSSDDKTVLFQGNYWQASNLLETYTIGSGRWQSGTVITSLRFLMSSGNITLGIFKLYGVSNS